jgi:hypothetical protein
MRATDSGSIWAYLLTLLAAVATAVAVLPACGDDNSGSDSDTGKIVIVK